MPRWIAVARGLLRGRDVAVGYALVVLVLAVALAVQPDRVHDHLVLRSSTNLVNLRNRPLLVLVVSAFVVPDLGGLWLLPVLLVVYSAAQRWVGRTATLLVAAFGHVFATVFVAMLLAAGIAHNQLDRSIAHEPDVGVSYGLAAVLSLLTRRLPGRLRLFSAWGTVGYLLLRLALSQTGTDLGHLVAWLIGLSMAVVGHAMATGER